MEGEFFSLIKKIKVSVGVGLLPLRIPVFK